MKKAIHPKIYTNTKVTCVCGNSFETISTMPTIQLEICSNCHPFFTGQHKFIDTEGRIEKFNKKTKVVETKKAEAKEIKAKKDSKTAKTDKNTAVVQEQVQQKSLKDMLKQLREEEAQLETTSDKKSDQ